MNFFATATITSGTWRSFRQNIGPGEIEEDPRGVTSCSGSVRWAAAVTTHREKQRTNERGSATEEGNSRTGYGSVDAHVPLHVTRLHYAKLGRATGYVFGSVRACFGQKLPESRLLTNKRIDPSSEMESLNRERPI